MACKDLTGEVLPKNTQKGGSGGAWSYIEGVLGGSGSISRFKQRKVHQKLANRHAGQLFGSSCRIIWGNTILLGFLLIVKKRRD